AVDVAAGLRRAADAAYRAVLRPVEGTILTVVRMAAEAVERAAGDGEITLTGVLERAAAAAHDAVASTPDLLPVLREAGVVDAGGDGIWNCHVHTDDIGAAIEAGIDAGRPHDIRVTDLLEQVADREEEAWVRDASGNGARARVSTGVVAVAVGDGLRRLLGG